ncbi:hypothetical protein ABE438_14710 [Bosea sp. TWI1241]|uniref:hypothetical protein n=1 Tax=Bosea sp. TWI1241 TaxID=3148904 RepID=UPI00320AD209
MADLKFAMIFEVRGLDAAAAEMKRMREMTGGQAVEAGRKAEEVARRETAAVKEAARARTVAAEQARAESARAERDIRRRAALERAAAEEARKARVREVTAAREQIRIDAQRREAEAKAARAARLEELKRRAELQRQDNMRAAAQRDAAADRIRMEERVFASIAKRTGRPIQDIIAEHRALGRAAEQGAQQATRAESRWRRLGQTIRSSMRGIRWNRVAGEAAAELAKQISKSVAEGMVKGVRNGATASRGLMDRSMGGRGPVRAGSSAGLGILTESWGRNQLGLEAENKMLGPLRADQARAARAAAEAEDRRSGGLVPLDQGFEAARTLAEGRIVADAKLMKLLGDTAVATGQNIAMVAGEFERSLREGSASFASARGATVTAGEDGSQTITYGRGGQDVSRTVAAGDRAGLEAALREFMARHEGAAERQQATTRGAFTVAKNTLTATAADALDAPYRRMAEIMERLNKAITGADGGGAKRLGEQIAEAMTAAERSIVRTAEALEKMAGPADRVAQALGGWKVAVGGLVLLSFAGWLTSVAAGIRAVAGASAILASTPAGRAMLGAAAAGYLLNDIWSGKKPEEGSIQAKAQAEMRAVKAALGELWTWANTPLNKTVEPTIEPKIATPPPSASAPMGAGDKQAQTVAAGEKAAQAVAMIEQVAPAARQMVAEVDGILAGVDYTSRGVAMMTTLAAGIRAGAGAVTSAVREVAQQARDYLPHSPAKVGPLSDLDRVKFAETLASSIRPDVAIRAVRNMVTSMRAAIPDASIPASRAGFGASPALARAAGGASAELDAALHRATMAAAGVPDASIPAMKATRERGFGASPELARAAGGASPELDEALRQATLAAAYGPEGQGSAEVVPVTSRAGPQRNLSVSYAPTITFNGGEIGDFWSQLESHKDSLVGMIQGSFSRSADLSFG